MDLIQQQVLCDGCLKEIKMTENDAAYLAGLIDGGGSIYCKKTKQKRNTRPGKPVHNVWAIRLEIATGDKDTAKWCHETFNLGSVGERKVKPGMKRQWRWRVCHRQCLEICMAVWPHIKNKLHKIEQVIDHYEPHAKNLGDNVIDLELEREVRKFNWNIHGS
jgi:hypothetical protein